MGSDSDSDAGSGNSEDDRMKALLDSWDKDEHGSESSSSSSEGEDEEDAPKAGGATKYDLNLQDNVVDHIVLAAPDFQEALKEFENMTGIKPSIVGSLRGLGTKSARVGLDNNTYIEIIAPDPKNSGPIGAALASELEEGTLVPYHYAIRSSEVEQMKDEYVPNELGWQPDHISMFGASPDGTPKKWEMLYMYGHKLGGCVPFYIDWGQCDHPSASIPEVGGLKSFIVQAPGGHKVHDLLDSVSGIEVRVGEPMIEFSFMSPEGHITFSADAPKGIKFPGFEEGDTGAGGGGDDGDGDYKFPGMPDLLPTEGGNGGGGGDDDDDEASAGDASASGGGSDGGSDVEVSDVDDSD